MLLALDVKDVNQLKGKYADVVPFQLAEYDDTKLVSHTKTQIAYKLKDENIIIDQEMIALESTIEEVFSTLEH